MRVIGAGPLSKMSVHRNQDKVTTEITTRNLDAHGQSANNC